MTLVRPSKQKQQQARQVAKAEAVGDVKLTVRVPARLHRGLKVRAAAEGVSVQERMIALVEAYMKGWDAGILSKRQRG